MALPIRRAETAPPPITEILVILTVKPGIAREQVMNVMPAEVRHTLRLYLNGKIRQWYSRGDGGGAIFLLATKDVAEASAIMDDLPLAKEDLIDHEYIPVGPLFPLRLLTAESSTATTEPGDPR